jgi:hypothetical protein
MKYFLIPLILGLIAIAGLNLYVDTTSRWWRTHFNFSENWKANQCWVTPIRIDVRKPRMQHIGMLPKIDTLGLGSSRFYNVETSMFPAGTRFYNASVDGATIWDYVAIWEKFKQQGNIPKHLIIYVDTWNFNKNTWQKYRWISTLPLVIAFLDDYPGNTSLKMAAYAEWLTGSFYEFSDLFSPAVLKVSLQELSIHSKTGGLKSNYISSLRDRPLDFPAWKNDGTHLFAQEDEQPKTLAQISEIGRNTGLGSMYVYMRDWETDANAIQLFNYLLSDTEKYGTDVLLVQPPFEQETFAVLKATPEYKDIPAHYATIMQSLLQKHPNTSYCDVLNPEIAGCSPTEFMDSSHTFKPCAQKILNYCLHKTQ